MDKPLDIGRSHIVRRVSNLCGNSAYVVLLSILGCFGVVMSAPADEDGIRKYMAAIQSQAGRAFDVKILEEYIHVYTSKVHTGGRFLLIHGGYPKITPSRIEVYTVCKLLDGKVDKCETNLYYDGIRHNGFESPYRYKSSTSLKGAVASVASERQLDFEGILDMLTVAGFIEHRSCRKDSTRYAVFVRPPYPKDSLFAELGANSSPNAPPHVTIADRAGELSIEIDSVSCAFDWNKYVAQAKSSLQ